MAGKGATKMRLIDVDELKGKAIADPDDGEYFVYCQDIDEAPTVASPLPGWLKTFLWGW